MTMLLLLRLLPNRVVAEGGPRPCGCHSWHHQELYFGLLPFATMLRWGHE